jgi:hypothetical protein
MDETAPAAPAVIIPDSPPSANDVLIDAWFVETFHNLGLDTPSFNRFRAAADELKRRLRAGKE